MAESTTIIRGKQAPYIKVTPGLTPYEWTGRCSRLTGITAPLGGVEWTECRSEEKTGEYIPDVELAESEGPVESSLVMKKSVRNLIAEQLKKCRWNIDVRYQPEGIPGDPHNWRAIDRMCRAKFTEYGTDDETSYASTDEGEVIVTAPFVAPPSLYHLWRLATELIDTDEAGNILCIDLAQAEVCASDEGPAADCIFVAGTVAIAGNPHFGISLDGGQTWTWTTFDGTSNTPTWTGDIVDIAAKGDLIIAVSTADTAHAVSQDQGATWTEIVLADYAADAPITVTIHSAFAIWIGGVDGHIWFSRNSGLDATTANVGSVGGGDAGIITVEDLMEIQAHSDKFVIAVGVANAIVFTENGGLTWAVITGPGAQDLITINCIEMFNTNLFLVGYADGEAYWTEDQGVNWTEDDQITDLGLTDVAEIVLCACERYVLVGTKADGGAAIYENVHGAPGYWEEIEPPGDVQALNDVACCGANLYVAVGDVTYIGAEGAIVRMA